MEVTARKRGTKWEYRFEVASIGGKRKQKSKGGFRTKAEAMKAGNEALAMYNATGLTRPDSSDMSLADFIDLYMEEYVRPNLKASTASSYEVCANRIKKHIGSYKLSSLTHTTLQGFANDLAKQLTKQSVKNILAFLKASISYATVEKNYLQVDPAAHVKVPAKCKKSNSDVRAYTYDEMQEYLRLLEGTPAHTAVFIALHTGMRLGEIYALAWDCIDLDKQVIHVKRNMSQYTVAEPKTAKSVRDIPFGDTLADFLKKLRASQKADELRCGGFYMYVYMDEKGHLMNVPKNDKPKPGLQRIDLIMRHAGGLFCTKESVYHYIYDRTEGFRVHNVRHTHATWLIESGVPIKTVQARLGHSKVTTTMDLYVDNTEKMNLEAVHAFEKAWTNRGQTAISGGK